MTPEQVNATLKAVSQSIISIRRRLADWKGPDEGRASLEHELEVLISVRDYHEDQAA